MLPHQLVTFSKKVLYLKYFLIDLQLGIYNLQSKKIILQALKKLVYISKKIRQYLKNVLLGHKYLLATKVACCSLLNIAVNFSLQNCLMDTLLQMKGRSSKLASLVELTAYYLI